MGYTVHRMRCAEEACRFQLGTFDRVSAKVFVQPRAPGGTDAIARLQYGPQARSCPSPHHAEMTPVLLRHEFEDGVRLPVPPHAQHDAVIGPLHRQSFGNSNPICAYRSGSSPHRSRTLTNRKRCTGCSTMAAISRLASAPIALIVAPPLPSTILRWLSR